MRKKIDIGLEKVVQYIEMHIDCPVCGDTSGVKYSSQQKASPVNEDYEEISPGLYLPYRYYKDRKMCAGCDSSWAELLRKHIGQGDLQLLSISEIEIEIENSVDYINS